MGLGVIAKPGKILVRPTGSNGVFVGDSLADLRQIGLIFFPAADVGAHVRATVPHTRLQVDRFRPVGNPVDAWLVENLDGMRWRVIRTPRAARTVLVKRVAAGLIRIAVGPTGRPNVDHDIPHLGSGKQSMRFPCPDPVRQIEQSLTLDDGHSGGNHLVQIRHASGFDAREIGKDRQGGLSDQIAQFFPNIEARYLLHDPHHAKGIRNVDTDVPIFHEFGQGGIDEICMQTQRIFGLGIDDVIGEIGYGLFEHQFPFARVGRRGPLEHGNDHFLHLDDGIEHRMHHRDDRDGIQQEGNGDTGRDEAEKATDGTGNQ